MGRGWGVAIYCRENTPFKSRLDLANPYYECLWISARPKWLPRATSRIVVACVYLLPQTDAKVINEFFEYFSCCYDTLIAESPDTAVIVAGDFNPVRNNFQVKSIAR